MPIPIGTYEPTIEVAKPTLGEWDPYVPPRRVGDDDRHEPRPPANPYASWTTTDWAKALRSGINPDTGRPWTAADLENAIYKQQLTPEMANAAMILKDAWANTGYKYRTPSMGNNAAWQQAFAQNPELNQIDWQKWAEMLGYVWPAEYSPEQSTLQFNPAALPQQYRQGAQNWWKSQGLRPTGSLGQYGYTQYQRAQGQPYKPLDLSLFQAIPDENLRQWMLWYASKAGLINGSYERPK